MASQENFIWGYRVVGTRSFGKFMPHITMFPVGELLNHDNVQSYYIYQKNSDVPDSSDRYSGIVDNKDHDEDLHDTVNIVNLTLEYVFKLNFEASPEKDMEKYLNLHKLTREIDEKEEKQGKNHLENIHYQYRPPTMDLTESEDKEASIVTGPTEWYKKGSEVYMSYGRYSNRQLLSTYGFALKENYYNYARVRVSVKDLCINEVLQKYAEDIDGFCVFKVKKNEICQGTFYLELLRAIRGTNWNQNSPINNFFQCEAERENEEIVLSGNEELIFSRAIAILIKELKEFPTSLKKDLQMLETDLPLRKYFAVLYRSQIKEIISTQIEMLQEVSKVSEKSGKYSIPIRQYFENFFA